MDKTSGFPTWIVYLWGHKLYSWYWNSYGQIKFHTNVLARRWHRFYLQSDRNRKYKGYNWELISQRKGRDSHGKYLVIWFDRLIWTARSPIFQTLCKAIDNWERPQDIGLKSLHWLMPQELFLVFRSALLWINFSVPKYNMNVSKDNKTDWLELTAKIVCGVQHMTNTAKIVQEVLTNCREFCFSVDALLEIVAT